MVYQVSEHMLIHYISFIFFLLFFALTSNLTKVILLFDHTIQWYTIKAIMSIKTLNELNWVVFLTNWSDRTLGELVGKIWILNGTCSSFLERSSTRLVWTTINGFLPLIARVYAFGTGFWRTYRSGASVFNIFAASCNNWWRSVSCWRKKKQEADNY